jgi:hypothetical protein
MIAAVLKLVVVVVVAAAGDILDAPLVDAKDRSSLLRANQIRRCGSLRKLDRFSSSAYQDDDFHRACCFCCRRTHAGQNSIVRGCSLLFD